MHAGNERGFTLIELLMSLAILAVLVTVALPSYATLIGRTHAQAARAQLSGALALARIAAVNHATHVVACPSADGQRCSGGTQWQHGWLVFTDLDHDRARAASEPVLAVAQALASGVAIVGTSGRAQVDYHPDGSAAGTNQTLTICDRAEGAAGATALVINQAGRVRRGTPGAAAIAACLHASG